jgi:hypothetical protein
VPLNSTPSKEEDTLEDKLVRDILLLMLRQRVTEEILLLLQKRVRPSRYRDNSL